MLGRLGSILGWGTAAVGTTAAATAAAVGLGAVNKIAEAQVSVIEKESNTQLTLVSDAFKRTIDNIEASIQGDRDWDKWVTGSFWGQILHSLGFFRESSETADENIKEAEQRIAELTSTQIALAKGENVPARVLEQVLGETYPQVRADLERLGIVGAAGQAAETVTEEVGSNLPNSLSEAVYEVTWGLPEKFIPDSVDMNHNGLAVAQTAGLAGAGYLGYRALRGGGTPPTPPQNGGPRTLTRSLGGGVRDAVNWLGQRIVRNPRIAIGTAAVVGVAGAAGYAFAEDDGHPAELSGVPVVDREGGVMTPVTPAESVVENHSGDITATTEDAVSASRPGLFEDPLGFLGGMGTEAAQAYGYVTETDNWTAEGAGNVAEVGVNFAHAAGEGVVKGIGLTGSFVYANTVGWLTGASTSEVNEGVEGVINQGLDATVGRADLNGYWASAINGTGQILVPAGAAAKVGSAGASLIRGSSVAARVGRGKAHITPQLAAPAP